MHIKPATLLDLDEAERWAPPSHPSRHRGFAVYRRQPGGIYIIELVATTSAREYPLERADLGYGIMKFPIWARLGTAESLPNEADVDDTMRVGVVHLETHRKFYFVVTDIISAETSVPVVGGYLMTLSWSTPVKVTVE